MVGLTASTKYDKVRNTAGNDQLTTVREVINPSIGAKG